MVRVKIKNISEYIVKNLALLINSKDITQFNKTLINMDHIKTYEAAIQHGVVGLIHENFKNLAITPDFPGFIEQINNYHNSYKALNNFVDFEAISVLKILEKEKIDVVVLKGFSLAQQVYNTPFLRPKTDIDILIRSEDKETIKNIFQKLGYINPRGWEPKAIINQFSYKKTLGKGVNVYFDIHLKISNSKKIENILNFDDLLKSANTATLNGINLINIPHALTHAAFHLLGHKASDDMVKLIWYYDIFLLIKAISGNEKQELLTLINKTGLANLMTHALQLTAQYFPSKELTILLKELEGIPFNSNFDYLLGNTSGVRGLWLTLQATKSLQEKISIVKETVFPPPEEIYVKYGKHTKWPLSVLYIRRIMSGTLKYLMPSNRTKK